MIIGSSSRHRYGSRKVWTRWLRLHDNGRYVDVGLDGLVWQNAAAVNVNLVANGDIVTEHCYVLETGPLADCAVPANNGALDPSVILDLGVLEQDAALEADTVTNDNVRADGDIGTDSAVLADLC